MPKSDLPSEIDDLKDLRTSLWTHLTEVTEGQKMGVGAVAGQLIKVIERIHQLEQSTEKEETIEDALAAARKRRTDRTSPPSRRGAKSAR